MNRFVFLLASPFPKVAEGLEVGGVRRDQTLDNIVEFALGSAMFESHLGLVHECGYVAEERAETSFDGTPRTIALRLPQVAPSRSKTKVLTQPPPFRDRAVVLRAKGVDGEAVRRATWRR